MGGGIDGPGNHLEIALAGFEEEIRRHQVAANGKLARTDFQSLLKGIRDGAIEQQADHEGRIDFSQAGEDYGIERDDHDARDFAGFAQSADQGMLSAPKAAGFQLQVEDNIVFLGKFENFFESGDTLADEFAGKPSACIKTPDFREGHVLNRAVAAGGTINCLVMDGHEMGVAGKLQVGFDEGDALRHGSPEGGQRIFRSVTRSTAMGNGQHASSNLLGNRAGRGVCGKRDSLSYANTAESTWETIGEEVVREAKEERRVAGLKLGKKIFWAEMSLALSVCLATLPALAQNSSAARQQGGNEKYAEVLAREVRHQVAVLPYLSVFDHIAFTLNGNNVTLTGAVVRHKMKTDAEAAVRSIEGVGSVVNQIEVLPASAEDDDLRRAVYRAIYEDPVLSRYAVEELPSIHIIIKNGNVALEGQVENEADKNRATARAGFVGNVHSVKNDLVVHAKEKAKR